MTDYGKLLSKGYDRSEARMLVENTVYEILEKWQKQGNSN